MRYDRAPGWRGRRGGCGPGPGVEAAVSPGRGSGWLERRGVGVHEVGETRSLSAGWENAVQKGRAESRKGAWSAGEKLAERRSGEIGRRGGLRSSPGPSA
jgi:hypothetical protein